MNAFVIPYCKNVNLSMEKKNNNQNIQFKYEKQDL